MDLLSPLILVCSLVSDTQLVSSIATVATDRQMYHVRSENELRGVGYRSKEEVKTAIRRTAGRRYVGPLGVPLSITREGRYSSDQLLDPCKNITVGTEYLKMFQEDCEASDQRNPRGCAVKLYAQWIGQPPDGFTQQVLIKSSGGSLSLDSAFLGQASTIFAPRKPKDRDGSSSTNIPQPTPPTPPTPPSLYKSK